MYSKIPYPSLVTCGGFCASGDDTIVNVDDHLGADTVSFLNVYVLDAPALSVNVSVGLYVPATRLSPLIVSVPFVVLDAVAFPTLSVTDDMLRPCCAFSPEIVVDTLPKCAIGFPFIVLLLANEV